MALLKQSTQQFNVLLTSLATLIWEPDILVREHIGYP
jgi:hypothetical protein